VSATSGNVSTVAVAKDGKSTLGAAAAGKAPASGSTPNAARGLDATLLRVAVSKVRPSVVCPNPRKHFDGEAMNELVASVKSVGILQPPLVRKSTSKDQEQEYELVAGERRWRAAKAAKLAEIPILVAELTDSEVVEMQHIENLQREGLSPIEEAESFAKLIGSGKYTAESLAAKLGIDRTTIFNRLKLTRLQKPVREALEKKLIEPMIATLLARIPDPQLQEKCLKEALKGDWRSESQPFSFRDLRRHIEEHYQRDLKEAKWNLNRVMEKPGDSCEACPRRSGNMLEQFPEFKGSANLCTDLKCFARKLEWASNEKLEAAKRNGQKTMTAAEFEKKRWHLQDLGLKDHSRNGSPTLKSLIGPEQAKKAIIAVDEEGEVHELMAREDLAAALKAAGVKPAGASSGSGDAQQALARKEALIESQAREQAILTIRDKARNASGPAFWELLARMACRAAHWDSVRPALKARKLKREEDADYDDRFEPLLEAAEGEAGRRELVVEILAREAWGNNLEKACEWAGVKLGDLVKQIKAGKKTPKVERKGAKAQSRKGKKPEGKKGKCKR